MYQNDTLNLSPEKEALTIMDKPKERSSKKTTGIDYIIKELNYLAGKVEKMEQSINDMEIAVITLVKIYRNLEQFEKQYFNFVRKDEKSNE